MDLKGDIINFIKCHVKFITADISQSMKIVTEALQCIVLEYH